ncbi:ABC transporter permease [Neobacillus notoginsengisoli]|uniref:Transport permease protein n=1 Tax=Neobacillus notoginsengisoli TaxID=1578198 RepID=A0A417YQW6_9BACI|nr:ABC transporter permease [Neobacillus notoginsengisoli]RHW37252.1 ABC transporter permease [Neobacillus notoginsengisoli]
MKPIMTILKELIVNIHLIIRLAVYEVKGSYQGHYLGVFWQFLSPALQLFLYWFVFGVGLRSGKPVGETPFFIWLMVGLIPWFFLSGSILQGSNSIYSKVNLVSKMKFPVSVLPSITIVGKAFGFMLMLLILFFILFVYGINPGLYLLQLPYYLLSIFAFLFATTLLFSTISTIVRDFQQIIQSSMRMLLYLSGIFWDINRLPDVFVGILKLNPLYYIIAGFRDTFLGQQWFFDDWQYTLYFWSTTLLILFIGSVVHIRFRKQFIDYI